MPARAHGGRARSPRRRPTRDRARGGAPAPPEPPCSVPLPAPPRANDRESARPAPASTPRRIRSIRGARRSGGAELHSCSGVAIPDGVPTRGRMAIRGPDAIARLAREMRLRALPEEPEGHQWEIVPIHVVAQIEMPRKPGAGEVDLAP